MPDEQASWSTNTSLSEMRSTRERYRSALGILLCRLKKNNDSSVLGAYTVIEEDKMAGRGNGQDRRGSLLMYTIVCCDGR